jgi:hypothetical protein
LTKPGNVARSSAALVLLVGLAGCGANVPSGPATTAVPSGVAAPATPSAPTGGSASASAATVRVDPALLRFVPGSGDGITLTFDPDTTATVATDPALAADVRALAIGLYTPTAADASAPPSADLVIVNVVELRDPSADEEWFRDWRDSYDDAACANAGGVVRRAETVLGGKTFFVGSCAGGAFTYHVRLADVGMLVSLTSVGPGRLGEKIAQRMAR